MKCSGIAEATGILTYPQWSCRPLLALATHIIHHSLTVGSPDNLINLKQRTDWNKKKRNPPKWDKSSRWEVSTPMLCHCGTCYFFGAGGSENLLWGAQNEVHCSQNIICFAEACPPVWDLKFWSVRAQRGNSQSWFDHVVRFGVIGIIVKKLGMMF